MFRKVVLIVMAMLIIAVPALAAWPSSVVGDFSEDLAWMKKSGMYGYIDKYGNWVIEPGFGDSASFHEGYIKLHNGSYSEYYDNTGNLAFTSAGYSYAGDVSNGLVAVRKIDNVFRGASQSGFTQYLYGYMDTNGNEVIELQFNNAGDFYEGLAFVQLLPDSETHRTSAPWAVIDTTGTVLYELDTSWENGLRVSLSPYSAKFCGGYAIIDGTIYNDAGSQSYGDVQIVINTDGERMFYIEYDYIDSFGYVPYLRNCGDGTFVLYDNSNKTYCYLDAQGNDLTGERYSCWYEQGSDGYKYFNVDRDMLFHDGLALVGLDRKGIVKPAFVDHEGNVVIPNAFEDAREFSEGYAAVCIDGKWGYIDTQGNIVVDPQYDNAREFCCGVAIVDIGEEWFIIDTEGNILY